MMSYSFRMLDLQGAIALSQQLSFRDDLDALDEGVRRSRTHAVEIWEDDRLVARVKLGNCQLDAGDLRSL